MSAPWPDDPIDNKPANPKGESIHSVAPRILNTAAADAAASDEHFGSFDYASQFDPSGQEFITFGRYDVGNNNIVTAVLQIRHLDGTISERTFRIGEATSITDPNYVKIDSVRGAHRHGQWVMNLAGHKIAETPDNHVRKMGQVKDQQVTQDVVWLVYPPFDGHWDDMSGVWEVYAEKLASIGAMSGKSETHFGASDTEIRSHIAKIVSVAVEHVG